MANHKWTMDDARAIAALSLAKEDGITPAQAIWKAAAMPDSEVALILLALQAKEAAPDE